MIFSNNILAKFLIISKIILFCCFINFIVVAQNVINNGNNIVVSNGANLIISKDFINLTSYNNDGKIDLDGNIILRGDWINNSFSPVVFNNIEQNPDGSVIMDGDFPQNISGLHPTNFENLFLTKSEKTLQVNDNLVKGILTIDAGLNLNSKKIILDNKNPSSIKYLSKYIKSETTPDQGYGIVQWNIGSSKDTYEVPFGTGNFNNDLNLTLTTNTAGQPSDGFLYFATYHTDCTNLPLPAGVIKNDRPPENVVDRYWIIHPGFSTLKPNVDISFSYTANDIKLDCNPNLEPLGLKAERYNLCENCWSDWLTSGNSFPTNLKVLVRNVTPDNFFEPWRLISDEKDIFIFFPNAFTPDNDGLNDEFGPLGFNLTLIKDFELNIFDRWGQIIFISKDIHTKWDGRITGKNEVVREGVYPFKATYKDKFDFLQTKYGHVTLLKTKP